MPVLNLTLAPEAVARLHDALVCLGKFSESVSIEARRDKVSTLSVNLSATNSHTFGSNSLFCPHLTLQILHTRPLRSRAISFSRGIISIQEEGLEVMAVMVMMVVLRVASITRLVKHDSAGEWISDCRT